MKTLIALLTLTLSAQTFAYDMTGKFGLGVSGGLPIPVFGNNFNSAYKQKWDASLYGRYHFTSAYGIDLGISHEAFKGPMKLKANNLNALGFWRTAGTANLSPIIGAGLGFTKLKDYTPNNLKLSLLARLGLEYSVAECFTVAGLVDYQYISKILGDMPGSRAHVIIPQVALTWYFGGEKAEPAKHHVEAAPAVKEEVKKVEAVKEEVIAKVENVGLKIEQVNGQDQIAIDVQFASGKSIVAPSYAAHLKQVAAFFKAHPETSAQIQGYTDNAGSAVQNTKLSQKRADAVRKYLINLGVDPKRLTAKGFGPENPIADNSTAEGKQKNRRVVAVVNSNK